MDEIKKYKERVGEFSDKIAGMKKERLLPLADVTIRPGLCWITNSEPPTLPKLPNQRWLSIGINRPILIHPPAGAPLPRRSEAAAGKKRAAS
jgi:hypothetical protein